MIVLNWTQMQSKKKKKTVFLTAQRSTVDDLWLEGIITLLTPGNDAN